MQWIPDPENPSKLIPRFNNPSEMGDYYNETKYSGKCATNPDMYVNFPSVGSEYAFAYKEEKTREIGLAATIFIYIGLSLLALGVFALIIVLAITFIAIAVNSVISTLKPGKTKVEDLQEGDCDENTSAPHPLKLLSYPDGSSAVVDTCTGKIISKSDPPPSILGDTADIVKWVVIAAGGVGLLLFLSKVAKPSKKKGSA